MSSDSNVCNYDNIYWLKLGGKVVRRILELGKALGMKYDGNEEILLRLWCPWN